MLRAIERSRVKIEPGKRYTLAEVKRIAQANGGGSNKDESNADGHGLTLMQAAALLRDEGEAEASGELMGRSAASGLLERAVRRFEASWLEQFGGRVRLPGAES